MNRMNGRGLVAAVRRFLAPTFCFLAAAQAWPALALTLEDMPLERRVAVADRIVRGEVLRTEAVESKEFGLETRVLVKVEETLEGKPVAEVEFTVPGGERDGRTVMVPGLPEYERGHEVVMLLQTLADGTVMPVGLPLGSFHVIRPAGGPPQVLPDADMTHVEEGGEPAAGAVGAGQPLETFLTTLRQLVSAAPRSGRLQTGAPPDAPVAIGAPAAIEAPAPAEPRKPASQRAIDAIGWIVAAALVLLIVLVKLREYFAR